MKNAQNAGHKFCVRNAARTILTEYRTCDPVLSCFTMACRLPYLGFMPPTGRIGSNSRQVVPTMPLPAEEAYLPPFPLWDFRKCRVSQGHGGCT
jgi:hypothetical protein